MIQVKELMDIVDSKDIILIDVREVSEFTSGHAKGARSFPLSALPQNAHLLKGYTTIYVMCRSGGRSAMATEILARLGLNATNVEGGYLAWEDAELPIAK